MNGEIINMKIKRVGLIGHIAFGQEKYDGQTVSTRMWQRELTKICSDRMLVSVDTYNYKHRLFQMIWDLIKCMFSCSHIVFMLSGNGLSVFLPLLYYSNKIFKKNIYHRVIGGNICKYVEENHKWAKYLNSFEVNWVQSEKMVERLKELGVENGEYLENFREIQPISQNEIKSDFSKPYKFCTFCRVSKTKGITNAIEAIRAINEKRGNGTAELHVYGPLEDDYKDEFESLVATNSSCVIYKGAIPSSEAVYQLKDYYFHLFPTTWDGEGFPGTLIDCYNAALPTIATNWAYNTEFIKDGSTGYIYDWNLPELLEVIIEKAIDDSSNFHLEMRIANLSEAKKYTADVVMSKVILRMMK